MDSIFANIGMGGVDERLNADNEFVNEYEAKVKALVADAVDYNMSELSGGREENLKYYYGELPALQVSDQPYDSTDPNGDYTDTNNNRSDAVSTDVRNTVMAIMPSLIRIFTSSDNIVDFVASSAEQVEMAKQATEDVKYTFWEENEGFLLLHNILKNALVERVGITKWCTDDNVEITQNEYHNVSQEQLSALAQEGGEAFEIVDQGEMTPDGLISSVTVRYKVSKPLRVIEEVAPEDFRIDRRATRVSNARLVGCSTVQPTSNLVKLGYSPELVDQYTGQYDYWSVERSIKNPAIDTSVIDRELVEYGEYWILIDQDGDGIDELHYICTMGSDYDIVKDEIVNYRQISLWCGDPRPGSPIGDAIADLAKDIQRYKSQLLRGALDNISSSMFPDIAVNENMANVDDLMADGVGRLIRTKGDPRAILQEFRSSFAGRDIFEMMGTLDMTLQSRTGISEASKGVDPKALQSTNLMGIDMIASGAQERIELIARILAETGFKDLMRGLLREIVQSPNPKRTLQINGKWVNYDQTLYDPNMRARVNPTLGKGNDMTKIMTLQNVQQTQLMIMNTLGMDNPFVKPDQYYNTIEDMMAIVNMRSIDRYFTKPTEEMMAKMSGPKEPTPEEKIATAEVERVKATTAIAIDKHKIERDRLNADDDFRRDKLGLDSLVKMLTSKDFLMGAGMLPEADAIVDERNTPV